MEMKQKRTLVQNHRIQKKLVVLVVSEIDGNFVVDNDNDNTPESTHLGGKSSSKENLFAVRI